MKKAVLVVLELLLFLVVFVLGSVVLPGAGVLPVLSIPAGAGRIFVYDGLLLMLALYGLFLLVAAARRRISFTWQMHTLAFALASVLGLLAKFGFKAL
jgi:hypothetical protein